MTKRKRRSFTERLDLMVLVRGKNRIALSRCQWIRQETYRCGKCKRGAIVVYDEKDHDRHCRVCGATVQVKVLDLAPACLGAE